MSRPEKRTSHLRLYVALGAGGLGAASLSVAAIAGVLATSPAAATTRAERQADIDRRKGYASTANVALAVGGALLAGATVVAVWP